MRGRGARTVAVIQARMGSSRLPGKMMRPLHERPLIEWVYRRVSTARLLDAVVAAVPDSARDAPLAAFLRSLGACVFTGSEHDVLGRFTAAAEHACADSVVRVCADNPLVSGSEIDALIEFFRGGRYDYAYNHVPRGNRYADGLGAECATMALLRRLDSEAREPGHREHVFDLVWATREAFSIGTFDPADERLAHPELRLDVDTEEDLRRLERLPLSIEMGAAEVVDVVLGAATAGVAR